MCKEAYLAGGKSLITAKTTKEDLKMAKKVKTVGKIPMEGKNYIAHHKFRTCSWSSWYQHYGIARVQRSYS